jgi:hypothetical protein
MSSNPMSNSAGAATGVVDRPQSLEGLPSTHAEVLAQYADLRRKHARQADAISRRRSRLLWIFALATIALTWLTLLSLHHAGPGWLVVVVLVVMVALVPRSLGLQTQYARQERILAFYDAYLRRASAESEPAGSVPRTGTDADNNLRPAQHLYERDLDLLGLNSLFQLLATVRTGLGERGLARYLLEPAEHTDTVERQQAVQELAPQTGLREEIALLGASKFQGISASYLDAWLADAPPTFPRIFRPVLFVTATLNVVLLLTGLVHLRPWSWVLGNLVLTLAVQGTLCAVLRSRVRPLLEGGARLQANLQVLSEGLALMQRTPFVSHKLQHLQRQAREPAGAVDQLRRLNSQLTIVEQRSKEYFLGFSLLLAAGTQAAISISAWKVRHAAAMRTWVAAWGEFEALSALGAYAFEHPTGTGENAWPELLPATHAPLFAAEGLAHPLLSGAVANDVSLSLDMEGTPRFLLISGSNMSGKSTLMRSIGINAVLAYAGAPVRAASMRLTPLTLGASLALTDSLAEGKSKFRAEVERLAAIVQQSKTRPVLFLVDEIFSGTNSADRRTAAAAVLRALLAHGAIGALSTHDLALTELANDTNAGVNQHMASPDADDPLAFDYKLKAGPNRSSNALAIVRMLGLDA